MGMNYYTKIKGVKECERCHHISNVIEVHLGKSSRGWKFIINYNKGVYYKTYTGFKKWLKDKKIINECGEDVSNKDFFKMIKSKQKERSHHSEHGDNGNTHIDRGYEFLNCEFS